MRVPTERKKAKPKLQFFTQREENRTFGQLPWTHHNENNKNELVDISKLSMDARIHEAHKSE
jgi:hypothetical protein